MLHIVASYHHIQFQGKPMIQNQENGEKHQSFSLVMLHIFLPLLMMESQINVYTNLFGNENIV